MSCMKGIEAYKFYKISMISTSVWITTGWMTWNDSYECYHWSRLGVSATCIIDSLRLRLGGSGGPGSSGKFVRFFLLKYTSGRRWWQEYTWISKYLCEPGCVSESEMTDCNEGTDESARAVNIACDKWQVTEFLPPLPWQRIKHWMVHLMPRRCINQRNTPWNHPQLRNKYPGSYLKLWNEMPWIMWVPVPKSIDHKYLLI